MDGGAIFRRSGAIVNRAMLPLLHTGPAQRLMGSSFATLRYTGRRSGNEIVLPVNYRRDGDDVVVKVLGPDAKRWWRNFTGEGAPLRITLGATEHDAHAVATRTGKGVTVRVRLTS